PILKSPKQQVLEPLLRQLLPANDYAANPRSVATSLKTQSNRRRSRSAGDAAAPPSGGFPRPDSRSSGNRPDRPPRQAPSGRPPPPARRRPPRPLARPRGTPLPALPLPPRLPHPPPGPPARAGRRKKAPFFRARGGAAPSLGGKPPPPPPRKTWRGSVRFAI